MYSDNAKFAETGKPASKVPQKYTKRGIFKPPVAANAAAAVEEETVQTSSKKRSHAETTEQNLESVEAGSGTITEEVEVLANKRRKQDSEEVDEL